MCSQHPDRKNHANITPAKDVFQIDGIEVEPKTRWWIQGKEYEVRGLGRKYLFSNGNPDTLYLAINDVKSGDGYIMTHSRFAQEAEPHAPRIERFVTPGQLLAAGPCEDGVLALGRFLFDKNYSGCESPVYEVTRTVIAQGKLSQAYRLQSMYDFMGQKRIPDSWLLFVAKVLNLVPKHAIQGPDRATLLRLLGIKP